MQVPRPVPLGVLPGLEDDPLPGTGLHLELGHHAPVETEEQKADLARAAAVEEAWVSALKKPGALLALVFGSLSLAWLASLTRTAPSMTWPWLLVLVMIFTWALALMRGGGRPEEAEPAKAPGGGGHH